MPWESLYISGLRTHLGLTPKYSVVRGIKTVSLGRHEMGYPTRILAVFANPVDTPPLAGIEHEEAVILGGLNRPWKMVGWNSRCYPIVAMMASRRGRT